MLRIEPVKLRNLYIIYLQITITAILPQQVTYANTFISQHQQDVTRYQLLYQDSETYFQYLHPATI
jgi:hypothetical protein